MRRIYNRTVLILYNKPIVTLAILFAAYGITRVFFTPDNVLDLLAKFMGFFVLLIVYVFYEMKDIKMVFWTVLWYIASFTTVLILYKLNINFIGKIKVNPYDIWGILYLGFWVCYFMKDTMSTYISKRKIEKQRNIIKGWSVYDK